ncbi:TonB-dependent receptor [Luteimonas marina]|uniref:TonB-dependent receptor n=1 Tax=Luteimonas marina TaxID=488485 RepID=A0A5C5U5U8_9GAMM|nr:TonB-dependent receptor [Luteimonas marina]TWT21169.1 TonB-dependent receptor [Luteimonas marina]
MRLKRNKLRDAIAFSLAASAVMLAGAGSALAQDAAEEQTATSLDTVTVTGTRIKSQTFTAASPITEINAEEFTTFGATTVEDLVNQYPQVDLSFDNFANNGAYGHATISMRGLGPERTLTLVNGRRLPFSRNEVSDPSIVPAAIVKRVDILSGGASAVYGADAVAGVVNFVLDDKFEGVSLNFGYSAYQHDNDNKYFQDLNAEAGYEAPTGNSGFDGISRNVDLVVGGSFGDNRGHAVGWLTWRENDALYHGQRDYSHCSVFFDEAVCGGSGTADPARFAVNRWDPTLNDGAGGVVPWPTGTNANYIWNGAGYENGSYVYNYAPINFYQRPDKRVTAGFMASYEINEYFEPYIEAMFLERQSDIQIAESGAFGVPVNIDCNNPLIGTLCADAGVTTPMTRVTMYKRNVEGGPRISMWDDSTHRITAGLRGNLFDSSWTYDVSLVSGKTKSIEIGKNDFLITRIAAAALGCDAGGLYGTFPGCQPYDIWTDSIDPEAAQAMAGTSFSIFKTSYRAFSAEANGYLGWGFPTADGEEIGLAVGMQRSDYSFASEYDGDSAAGNFAGAGAASLPVDASNTVNEFFFEAALPIYVGEGAFNRFDASLGYRYSDDDTSGNYDTYKLGLSSTFWDSKLLLRAGYNRAVRAPGLNDLYYTQRIALSGSGTDLCAGANPAYTAEQCARTGVPLAAYGNVTANPANQYNQQTGGNPNLAPEEADTYTIGFAVEPIENLNLSLDWYSIEIEGAIGGIGYNTIQILCMEQQLYCDRIHRDARAGEYDLWVGLASDPGVGYVDNLPGNIGIYKREGLDLAASYSFALGPGRLSTSLVGNYVLKDFTQTLASEPSTAFDCKGLVNDTFLCQTPEWRHVFTAAYSWDRYKVGMRWRYVGEMDYNDVDGTPLSDVIWLGDGVSAYNYLDLNGSVSFGQATVSLGVNNVLDKEPPFSGDSGLSANANALGGYDQVGRYVFGSISLKF